MRPPEFTGGNLDDMWEFIDDESGASMRPPEFTGGNLWKLLHSVADVGGLQ